MSQEQFRICIALMSAIFLASFLWIGAKLVASAEREAAAAEAAAENGRFEQVDVMKYGAGHLSSSAPTYFDTRTGEKK